MIWRKDGRDPDSEVTLKLAVNYFAEHSRLDDTDLKPLADDQLAAVNPKDALLAQLFDFSLLPQVLKEGP